MNCLGYNKNPLLTVALVWLYTEIVSRDLDSNNSKAHIEAVSLGWTFQMTYRFTDNDNPAEAGLDYFCVFSLNNSLRIYAASRHNTSS